MTIVTVQTLIKILRRPGKAYMPVMTADDAFPIRVEKAHLIAILSHRAADDPAPWYINRYDGSDIYLEPTPSKYL